MAGLLDALFDPSLYSGAGGLLSRLSPSLGQIPQSQGFDQSIPLDNAQWPWGPVGAPKGNAGPIAVGDYQMPRTGSLAQFTPIPNDPAALPPNAQPTQGQLPSQVPVQTPSFGPQGEGAFTTGLRALGNPGGAINKIADAVQGFSTGQTPLQRQQSQLFQAYVGAGLSPSQAYVAVLNPNLAGNLMGGGQTDDIKEYQFAKKEEPGLTFEKFMARKKATSGEYSLNPVYGTDDKGNTVLLQMGKAGDTKLATLPPGVKVSSGVDKIDLGTHWGIIDKKSGSVIGTQPKDLQGKEAAEERGKQQGQAQASLPGALTDAEETKKKIDQLLSNEGLNSIVGPLDQFRPTWTLGKEGNDALARYNQLKGTAFLQAYSLLRGGGAITDIEGKKAESAMARLDRAQNEEDFKAALKDFRDAIDVGVAKLRARAGGQMGSSEAAAPPKRIRLNADGTIAQ